MISLEDVKAQQLRVYKDYKNGIIEESVANDFIESLEDMEAFLEEAEGEAEAPTETAPAPVENNVPAPQAVETYNLVPLRGCNKIKLGMNAKAVQQLVGSDGANSFNNKTSSQTVGPLQLVFDNLQNLVSIETTDRKVTVMNKAIIGKPIKQVSTFFKGLTQSGNNYVSVEKSMEIRTNGNVVIGVAIGVKGKYGETATTESTMVNVLADLDLINY